MVSSLSSIVKRFLAANEEAVKTEQLKNDIIMNRTVKPAAEAADLMEATVEGAQKRAMTSKDEVMADTAQANRINLIMAIVVVISLIASVVFSFLGVSRPMTRLNGALGKMAGGNLDVVIPGASRGDEIGDLAKTVTVIRENAEQKAREEAEAKVKQDLIAAQRRKEEMIKLADDFEGAVGEIVETVSSASTELEASAEHADIDRRACPGTDDDGGGGFRGSDRQCAVGGFGHRGDGVVHHRDQPSGSGIGADGQ